MSSAQRAAINAAVVPVVEYAPDPRGHWTAYALTSRTVGELNRSKAVVAWAQSFGVFLSPQQMTGAAAATAQGVARAVAPKGSELIHQRSTTDDTTQAIFRSRMARQR